MKAATIAAIAVIALIAGFVYVSGTASAPALGAVSGPDITSPYLSVNGVATFYNRKAFTQASTTVCAVKSPNATSTLVRGSGVAMRVSSTSASVITIAKSATAYATTTLIGSQIAVAANAQAHVVASTTAAQDAAGAAVFAPNTYLVVSMSGGAGTFSPTGTCHADFTVL